MQPFEVPSVPMSKRRPLAERVPECVPRPENSSTSAYDVLSGAGGCVHQECFAPLWRASVEDWLKLHLGSYTVCLGNLQPHQFPGIVFSAPNWLDVLNATGHYLADRYGIAP
jgi:hypothetical protein